MNGRRSICVGIAFFMALAALSNIHSGREGALLISCLVGAVAAGLACYRAEDE